MQPFRAASMARVKRELKRLEVVVVPGTHPDFMLTSRDRVAQAMKGFLARNEAK